MIDRHAKSASIVMLAFLLGATAAFAQAPPSPAPPSAPAPAAAPAAPVAPPSPITPLRNKLSAGDLLSAESIAEVHRAKYGEDASYLAALGWLARGALMLGDVTKAARYDDQLLAYCADSLALGGGLAKHHEIEGPYGAAIEARAQLLERSKGLGAAATYVRGELARLDGSPAFRSRLHKRLALLALEGSPAPELAIEDWVGERPAPLAALRGKPVVLFLWAEWCGDCKAQAAALGRAKTRWAKDGVLIVPVTRLYEDSDSARVVEKARVDSVWKAVYTDVGPRPIVLSTASMVDYGGSSTPTFVFIDRKGIVRRYTPTRLTDAEFDRTLAALVK